MGLVSCCPVLGATQAMREVGVACVGIVTVQPCDGLHSVDGCQKDMALAQGLQPASGASLWYCCVGLFRTKEGWPTLAGSCMLEIVLARALLQ